MTKHRFKRERRVLVRLSRVRPGYPPSDHFDGHRFANPSGHSSRHRVVALLRWTASRPRVVRLRRREKAPPAGQAHHPHPHAPFSATWIGHATVLVRMGRMRFLTDPIWSARCSPLAFAGPRRQLPPGMPFEKLPHIDFVLISHNHYDHLDLLTVRRLARRFDPLFVVPLGLAEWFRQRGMRRVVELDWWQSTELDGVRIHAVPAQHYSGRTPWDTNQSLWAGFVVEGQDGPFYFAGDTGYGEHFGAIGQRYGPFALSAIPIGAYSPRWFMGPMHIDPAEAVQAHLDLGSLQSMAIHFGTFRLTDEPIDEPPRLLAEELARLNLPRESFWVLRPGETRAVEPAPSMEEISGVAGA